MGGTPSKSRGRGDAPDIFERGSTSDTTLRHTASQPSGRYSKDRKLHARWEQMIEGSLSTPSLRNDQESSTSVGNKDNNTEVFPTTVPSSRGDEPAPATITPRANESIASLPPKIQLQILSPVHSRQQIRASSNYQRKPFIGLRVPCVSTSNKENDQPSSSKSDKANEPKLFFLKQPAKEFQKDSTGSEQEINTPRASRSYLQQQQQRILHQQQNHSVQRQQQQQQTFQKHNNLTQAFAPKKKRVEEQHEILVPPPTTTISTYPSTTSTSQENGYSSSNYIQSEGFHSRPSTRTITKSPPKYGLQLNHPESSLPLTDTDESKSSACPPREQSAVSTASSRKLKVKGLKNFVDTHKPCPPLWAKQFPCRSKFHPDTYLYDFEGSNAPKRPVATMEKCSKKCGRCNRCGIYVDNICNKCSMCAADCKCPKQDSFAPSPEHFLSQLFGPSWSQSTRVEVNGQPVVADKPRLNLHAASSNNPLKIKEDSTKEGDKSNVLPTGYDSYTPTPGKPVMQPGYPSYPPYPYGAYPSYPPWPGCYPGYMAPMPPPVPISPYYYPLPPAAPPPYSYPVQ